jgi:hypothetical protein
MIGDLASDQAAETTGAGPWYVEEAKRIKGERAGDFEAIKRGDKTISQVMREMQRAEVSHKVEPLPSGKYRVIYADPPWRYSDSGIDQYGPAERHYPTLSTAEYSDSYLL